MNATIVQNTKKMTPWYDGYKKVCPHCGKEFYCINPREYTYVLVVNGNRVYYCCYTCWNEAKRKLNRRQYRRMR